jgi:hypothetical protein
MTKFTKQQYLAAAQTLLHACEQLEPDGRPCVICGDTGHQAFECGHNPLVAVALCQKIVCQSLDLHETLHELAGFNTRMGETTGPAKVIAPAA